MQAVDELMYITMAGGSADINKDTCEKIVCIYNLFLKSIYSKFTQV